MASSLGWDFQSERLGSLEIDDQLEFGRLHDRKGRGLLAPEHPAGRLDDARAVADQAAGGDVLAPK
jgi:hypothetical protein